MTVWDLIYKIGSLHLELPSGIPKDVNEFKKSLINVLKTKSKISVKELASLPPKQILKIVYDLPPEKVLMCLTSPKIKASTKITKICSRSDFWTKKYKRDFKDYDTVKPISLSQIYIYNLQQNQELRLFLITYSNYEHFKFKSQKELYNKTLLEFKNFKKYIHKNMFKNLDDDSVESLKGDIRSKFINLDLFSTNRHILLNIYKKHTFIEVLLDMYLDQELLTRMLNIFNSIIGTNYTFEDTLYCD